MVRKNIIWFICSLFVTILFFQSLEINRGLILVPFKWTTPNSLFVLKTGLITIFLIFAIRDWNRNRASSIGIGIGVCIILLQCYAQWILRT